MIAALGETGIISYAAQAAGVNRVTHYRWLARDPVYATAAREAKETAVELLEEEARRRAVDGVCRPVLYRGKYVMVPRDFKDPDGFQMPLVEVRYSDTLLIFLLKAARPGKYCERYQVRVEAPRPARAKAANEMPDWFKDRAKPLAYDLSRLNVEELQAMDRLLVKARLEGHDLGDTVKRLSKDSPDIFI